jgi:hypothetical protein
LRFEARDPKTDVGQGNLVVCVVDTEVTLTPAKKKNVQSQRETDAETRTEKKTERESASE